MALNGAVPTGVLFETDKEVKAKSTENITSEIPKRKYDLVWLNIILLSYLHLGAVYGLWLVFTSAKLPTILTMLMFQFYGGFGVVAGAHRLWSHRCYKAKFPLRVFLMIGNNIAFQDAIIDWARDHRLHHKYSDTDADPYNASRGFFFSHVGWLVCRKHPLVKEKGKTIDLSDLWNDPVLAFQKKYYLILMPLFAFILPVFIPMHFWDETFNNAHYLNFFRYAVSLNLTWLVNSAAHMYGNKPYNKFIKPANDRFFASITMGEGWHNFHHVFPWSYKTSELGKFGADWGSAFIELMAKTGLAYELKTVSEDVIRKRVKRTGDGSHEIWGWGDKDQSAQERTEAVISYNKDSSEL